jgi:hypothetical protein
MYPYATEELALRDVLDLSRGMTYKAAAAGLDLGGGKAVIIGDPLKQKSDALLRAYGRFVNRLAGVFYTAGGGIGVPVVWAHLTFIPLAEPHDEASCHKIHGLGSNKHRITDHRCVDQEEQ